jgi:Ca-activated chloride channel homolog
MKLRRTHIIVALTGLIALTSLIIVGLNHLTPTTAAAQRGAETRPAGVAPTVLEPATAVVAALGDGPLAVTGQLVQEKFFSGGDGEIKLWLTLHGARSDFFGEQERQPVDLVVVLDQSGSMEGAKIQSARLAVQNLLDRLSASDRFALYGYSDGVNEYAPLTPVTDSPRQRFQAIAAGIRPGGATNLSGGLQRGIKALVRRRAAVNRGKLILISDGLANRGITDDQALGQIASVAVEKGFAISTVGVGDDFHEDVMTLIADRGMGNYYYLDNLAAFAEVFEQEFYQSATAAAHGLEISIPLPDGVTLVDASGYPITRRGDRAIVHYGDVGSGQTRRLFLTFRFPTTAGRTYHLSDLVFAYTHQGEAYSTEFSDVFQTACVDDRQMATDSIDAAGWALSSYQLDNNRFETRVAAELKNGDKDRALALVAEYEHHSQTLFDQILASGKMTAEIQRIRDADEQEIAEWRTIVADTFTGSRQEIAEKQSANSKLLQYRSYQQQRSK